MQNDLLIFALQVLFDGFASVLYWLCLNNFILEGASHFIWAVVSFYVYDGMRIDYLFID